MYKNSPAEVVVTSDQIKTAKFFKYCGNKLTKNKTTDDYSSS